jgi:putative transposase
MRPGYAVDHAQNFDVTRDFWSRLMFPKDEWQLQRRYMQLEGLQTLSDNQTARLSAVVN